MSGNDLKEMQKTLDEMNKRVADFQAGKTSTSESSTSLFFSSNLKLILTIVGVLIVIVISVFMYVKNNDLKTKIEALSGDKVVHPKDGPPILQSFYEKK